MPNWCSNSLTIEGPDADAFLDSITFDHGKFSRLFNRFVPMPEELDIMNGRAYINGKRVERWRYDSDGEKVAVPEDELEAIRAKFGTDSWYHWSIGNWGTKWDTDGSRFGNRLVFDTPWSPPLPFVEKLSRQYPQLTFTLAYAEGGEGFFGTYVVSNGEVAENEVSKAFYKKNADFDSSNYEDYLTAKVIEHLDRYGLHEGG